MPTNVTKLSRKLSQSKMMKYAKLYGQVEVQLVKEGKPLTNKNVMLGMEKAGWKGDRWQFYYIQKKWQENSNFVVSIAETQYSAMIEDIYRKLMNIEDQCFELAEENWTVRKTRTGDGSEGSSYVETEDNQYKPKHDFLKLAKEVQKEKRELLKGDVINVSVAMLEKKFQKLRDESEAKTAEIQHLKKQLKEKQD